MAWCDRGCQILLTIVGAFAAFSLMTIAIGTDYWLYSRAYICNATNVTTEDMQPKKTRGDLTHSGLWRICCIEGTLSAFWSILEFFFHLVNIGKYLMYESLKCVKVVHV